MLRTEGKFYACFEFVLGVFNGAAVPDLCAVEVGATFGLRDGEWKSAPSVVVLAIRGGASSRIVNFEAEKRARGVLISVWKAP